MKLTPCRLAFSAALSSRAVRGACPSGHGRPRQRRGGPRAQPGAVRARFGLGPPERADRGAAPTGAQRRDRRRQPRGRGGRRRPRAARLPHPRRHAAHLGRRRVAVPGGGDLLRVARRAARGPGGGGRGGAQPRLRPPLPRHRLRRHPAGRGLGQGLPVLLCLRRQLGRDEERAAPFARREDRHDDARRPGAHASPTGRPTSTPARCAPAGRAASCAPPRSATTTSIARAPRSRRRE